MNPWEQYVAPDPRVDPANWDAFGAYICPTGYQPDYRGGTIGTSYQPSPTNFVPGSVYTVSDREYVTPRREPALNSSPRTAPSR